MVASWKLAPLISRPVITRLLGDLSDVEEAVRRMTQMPAQAWGFSDRGEIRAGMAADLNIIDLDVLTPDLPELVHDLPGGARRLRQTATGFRATIVNGEAVVEDGEPTGSTSGMLLRGPLAS